MLSFIKPSEAAIEQFRAAQANSSFSYAVVGATASEPPPGYSVDHSRIELGSGQIVFQRAKESLRRWEQFRFPWIELHRPDTPIETGRVVAVAARLFGTWWLNGCRIVYVVDETGPIERFGFAYGTLERHAESGEERFLVEWDHADDRVSYDILAFSRPNFFLGWLGYPILRSLQELFRNESSEAMRRSVATTC